LIRFDDFEIIINIIIKFEPLFSEIVGEFAYRIEHFVAVDFVFEFEADEAAVDFEAAENGRKVHVKIFEFAVEFVAEKVLERIRVEQRQKSSFFFHVQNKN
jgi:hypothetical protein